MWLDTVAYRESSLQLVRNMEKVASLRQDAASLEVATLKMSAEAATAKLQQVERQENATQMQIFQSPAAEAERQRRSEIERETRSRAQRIERPQLR
ncbi:hypothetical protein D3C72_2233730 [compost metagenome]